MSVTTVNCQTENVDFVEALSRYDVQRPTHRRHADDILLRPWLIFDRVSDVPKEQEAPVIGNAIERKDGVERANMEIEETVEACLERLGRMRPEKFKSLWAEIGFCFSIVMSQLLTVRIISDSGAFTILILV